MIPQKWILLLLASAALLPLLLVDPSAGQTITLGPGLIGPLAALAGLALLKGMIYKRAESVSQING